jgi:hypothetical protein
LKAEEIPEGRAAREALRSDYLMALEAALNAHSRIALVMMP